MTGTRQPRTAAVDTWMAYAMDPDLYYGNIVAMGAEVIWDTAFALAREAAAPQPGPVGHQPGDHHQYRITCEVCGERGMVTLTITPETSDVG